MKIKAFCKGCNRDTNHTLNHGEERRDDYGDWGEWFHQSWQIIKCDGCESFSFRYVSVHSEDQDPEDGSYFENIKLYPLRGENILSIKNFYNVPIKIRNIYRETVDAFNNGLFVLCSGGLRATIEGICNNEGIKDGTIDIDIKGKKTIKRKRDLQGKISGLYEKGILTKKHSEILHEHRFLGNDELHTLDAPSAEELKIAIEIIDHTLENLYELTEKVGRLRDSFHKRKNKKGKIKTVF